MRLKPTEASFSVSEIHFDSPEPSDRKTQREEPLQDESLAQIMEQEVLMKSNTQPVLKEAEEESKEPQSPPSMPPLAKK